MEVRIRGWALALASAMLAASPAAGETARTGLALAAAAADAWADDARPVWIENDAPLDTQGQAAAWGYLYYSPGKHAMRSWSVRAGKIVAAEDHAVVAEAPAVDPEWKDSDAIAAAARAALDAPLAGTAQLESLVLVRGVFAKETAWVAVFSSGTGPRLFLLLDARDGDLLKRWRG